MLELRSLIDSSRRCCLLGPLKPSQGKVLEGSWTAPAALESVFEVTGACLFCSARSVR